jgi:ketosteroid isomerase-like protein
MIHLWLTMASLLLLSSAGQAQTSATADTILRIQRELAQATLQADAAVYEQYLTDDYTFTSAAGRVSTKAEVIGELRASEFRFESFQTDKEVVRIYGDAAVVIGRASGRGTNPGGEPFAGEYRFTAVYVRTGLGWRLVAWQTTAIPEG